MGVRDERAAGRRRPPRGRARFVALALALYAAAAASVTWPAVLHFGSAFLSGGAPGHGEAAPGDHLQTLYHWWLVGDRLEHVGAPWLDPYSFRPEAGAQPNFPGWPYGFAFWPLQAAFGLVLAWNLLQVAFYVAAGLVSCAWLRELGLARAAALAGGLAFSIAPYRAQQSVGHLLGPISIMLPLALWAVERARRGSIWWLAAAGAALASIPLSGQVHLALGAIPFVILYALVRFRARRPRSRRRVMAVYTAITGVAAAAIGAGILVRQTVIVGSTQAGGRSLDEVRFYSARWGDFLARHVDHARSEQFVYLGWTTPLLALGGLYILVRARCISLAVLLGAGALVPILLALGPRLPLYTVLWHALPPFRFPRVPERLLPIACLCIGALVAALVAATRSAAVAAVVVALLFTDLHVRVYGKSVPGEPDAVAAVGGRLLELPVFDPGIHYGSVYLLYDTAARVERPGGYSTTAPLAAKSTARRLERLNCGDWSDGTARVLRRLGVRTIALHLGLYVRNSATPNRSYFAWRGLIEHGWSLVRRRGPVWVYARRRGPPRPSLGAPLTRRPVFCQGWYGNVGHGWPMSETHAPFWIYGKGTLQLRIANPHSHFSAASLRVDGRDVRRVFTGGRGLGVALGPRPRWHLVTFDVQHLVRVGKRNVGLTLLAAATSPEPR